MGMGAGGREAICLLPHEVLTVDHVLNGCPE
jgi:hypothetical protein